MHVFLFANPSACPSGVEAVKTHLDLNQPVAYIPMGPQIGQSNTFIQYSDTMDRLGVMKQHRFLINFDNARSLGRFTQFVLEGTHPLGFRSLFSDPQSQKTIIKTISEQSRHDNTLVVGINAGATACGCDLTPRGIAYARDPALNLIYSNMAVTAESAKYLGRIRVPDPFHSVLILPNNGGLYFNTLTLATPTKEWKPFGRLKEMFSSGQIG